MARVVHVLAALSLLAARASSQDAASDATVFATPAPFLPPVFHSAAFERADTDHNGVVDPTEFTAFSTALAHAVEPFLPGGPISNRLDQNVPTKDKKVQNDKMDATRDDEVDAGDDKMDETDADTHDAGAGAGTAGGWQHVLAHARPKLRTAGAPLFWSGFMSGLLTIWATEIGDKTFFIAAILSMKKDRVVVFAGAIGALIVMTVLSVVMGVVATKFLPPSVTHYLGAVLVRARTRSC